MIKESAIKRTSDGKVWTGKRHGDVLDQIFEETNIRPDSSSLEFIHGFITDTGEFVDRKVAFKIAVECEQLLDKDDPWAPPTLMSEDLY